MWGEVLSYAANYLRIRQRFSPEGNANHVVCDASNKCRGNRMAKKRKAKKTKVKRAKTKKARKTKMKRRPMAKKKSHPNVGIPEPTATAIGTSEPTATDAPPIPTQVATASIAG